MSITDLIGQFERLGGSVDKLNSKVESITNDWEKVAKKVGMTVEELDSNLNEFENLNEDLASINEDVKKHAKDYKELKKKGDERDVNEKKYFDQLEKERKDQQKIKTKYDKNLAKFGGKSPDEIKSLAQQKKQKDVNLREARKNEGGLSKALGKLKGNPWIMVADMAIKAIEWGIGKMTEYIKLGYENEMRAMQAITTSNVNTMRANLSLWQNSMSGAYEAQDLAMSSNLALIEAQNATDLANTKFRNSFLKWIPIYGSVLSMQETEMEMEQKMQEMRIKNAMEYIRIAEGLAKQTDDYLYKQDQAIHDYTRSIGLSQRQTTQFERRMLDLNVALSDIGRTAEDVLKIQSQAQQQSGRLINYSNKDYETVGAVGRIMGDENVARFNAEMVLFNQSVESSANIMTNMYQYANRMGLSQKKLTQNVLNNMKLAEKYQFKGGVQGYIQLAKVAENLRFDLNKLGSVIEKIQTGGLEGIIKQSAQLQVLGGGYAMNADPFRMAFNAFSDPQGLVESIADMARGEGVFDRKTGQLTFGIASQMRMNAAAQQLNLSREDFMNMVRERDKKDRVSAALKNSRLSQDQKDAIANSAQWDAKRGEWYVNTIHGGRKSMNDFSNNPNLINDILSDNTNEQLVEYAKGTLSATERTAQATQFISALIGGADIDDFNKTVDDTAKATMDGAAENTSDIVQSVEMVHAQSVEAARKAASQWGGLAKNVSDAYDVMKIAEYDASIIKGIMEAEYAESFEKYKKRAWAQEAYDAIGDKKIESDTYMVPETGRYGATTMNQYTDYLYDKTDTETLKKYYEALTAQKEAGVEYVKEGYSLGDIKKVLKERGEEDFLNNVSYDNFTAKQGESQKAQPTNDAFASAKGTPMAIAAKDITSIHDGLAMADKRDSAVFAKTGGPFDRLFNGVFNKINAVYDTIQHPEKLARMAPIVMKTIQEMPQKLEGIGQEIKQNVVGGNNNPIKFEPLKIEMNGRLELSSGGNSVDIMSELQNNPLLVREIAKMISDSLSSKLYGGKSKLIPGQNSYFS